MKERRREEGKERGKEATEERRKAINLQKTSLRQGNLNMDWVISNCAKCDKDKVAILKIFFYVN